MRNFVTTVMLGGLTAGPGITATVSASATVSTTAPGRFAADPEYAEVEMRGLAGPSDTGIDSAAASANLRTGQIRFRASDGRQTSDQTVYETLTRATAGATIEETLFFDVDSNGDPYTAGLGIDFEMDFAAFDGGFGQFYENPAIGGLHGAATSVLLEVIESRLQSDGTVLTNRSFGQAGHNVVAQVRFPSESGTYEVIHQATTVPQSVEFFRDPDDPANPWQVTDVRTTVSARAEDYFAGSIEIDYWIDRPTTISFRATAGGSANGGAGTFAGVSSLNTSSLYVDVPDGAVWRSDSGRFLVGQTSQPGAVPLPASGVLMLAGGAFLAVLRRRRGA